MTPYFVTQMAMYSSYHRDGRNKASHLLGVPMVAFSILVPMAMATTGLAVGGYDISLATLFGLAVLAYWLRMDATLGIVTAALFVPLFLLASWTVAQGSGFAWSVFGATFVGGWIVQLAGHAFEGRRPALTDSFIQVFIAPMFIVAEVLFAAGLRHDIRDAVEGRWQEFAAPATRRA